MRPLTKVAIKAGLIPQELLAEVQRWGFPLEVSIDSSISTLEEVIDALRGALESAEQVRVQDTYLDAIRRFVDPAQHDSGTLVVADGLRRSKFKTLFSRLLTGSVLLPYRSEGLFDMMQVGSCQLTYESPEDELVALQLSNPQLLYYGDQPSFVLCMVE